MTNPKSQIPNPKSRRRGFTLVELLVVVMIITILATIVLFAMFNATEAARAARTRSMVARINDLLVPMWESYRTRRVPITYSIGIDYATPPDGSPPDGADNDGDGLIDEDVSPRQSAELRLIALRELMRLELPDRKSDVVDDPVSLGGGPFRNPPLTGFPVQPALWAAYHRQAMARTGSMNNQTIEVWTRQFESSECLYMILSRIQDGDTNGLEFVRETEITDQDNDGMPEIVDGWGKPIAFLRWAPGFIPANGGLSALHDIGKRDPFDPLNVLADSAVDGLGPADADNNNLDTFYLFPLVMSAGPDKEWDIAFDAKTSPIQYSTTTPTKNDPFSNHGQPAYSNGTPWLVGTPEDINDSDGDGDPTNPTEHIDNIHNHLISTGVD